MRIKQESIKDKSGTTQHKVKVRDKQKSTAGKHNAT